MLNRRQFLLRSSLAGAALLARPAGLLAAGRQEVKLTVLHTNDMHSRIDPFSDGQYAGLGGMARRATLVQQIRQAEEHVLLLDAGDVFQGTPYFNFYGGELEFKLMSGMGYDAATLGNHDFDNGLEGLQRQLPHARFPFLTANYDFSATPLKGAFSPWKIFRRGPLKIGVFGVGIELRGLVPEKLYGNTIYLDPIAKAKDCVAALQAQGCHYIICLSHLGYRYEGPKVSDQTLVRQVPGLDLILGGHTHTFLDKPTPATGPDGRSVLIGQTGWGGINLGRVDVSFDRKGQAEAMGTSLPIGGANGRV